MSGYVKIYGSILGSSIWAETLHTRIVWITMLALADQYGRVEASVSGLARFANVTISQCRAALEALSAPDPDSKSPEWNGRRVEKCDGGWTILNYLKYREMRSAKQVAEAERKARWRGEKRDTSPMSPDIRTAVDATEAVAVETALTTNNTKPEPEGFAFCWAAYPKRAGDNSRKKALSAYRARLAAGVSSETMLAGVERYAAFIRADGSEGTKFVKMAATFFGPDECWTEAYEIPKAADEKPAPKVVIVDGWFADWGRYPGEKARA